MLKIQHAQLIQALQRELPGMSEEAAAARADALIAQTDVRLEENIRQWMAGQPISDLWVGKYCINAILAIQESRDFLSALDAMNLYLQDSKAGELRIWRARR